MFLCCEVGGPEESLKLLINKHNVELSLASVEIYSNSLPLACLVITLALIVCSALIIRFCVCICVGVREKINSAEPQSTHRFISYDNHSVRAL